MIKCGWYKFPSRSCSNEATEFFISNIEPSKGVIPRNRAVCSDCANSSLFNRFSCTKEEHEELAKSNPEKFAMSARKVSKREWLEEELGE